MFHVKQKRVAFWCPAGACLLCCLPTLPFVCLSAPSPRPALAERSSRREGGDFFVLFCRGLAPPAPLRLSPDGIGFFCRGSAFLPPSPPPPSPVGKGEIFCFLMQGAPPLASPALSRPRHLQSQPLRRPAGVCPVGHRLPPPLVCFLPPSPRPPSRREGGRPKLFHARGSAPCIPGAEPGRHWLGRGWRPRHPLRLSLRGTGLPGGSAPCIHVAKPARCWLAGRLRPLHSRG